MFYEHKDVIDPTPGYDLTELLNVTKYDIDLANPTKSQTQVTGQPRGSFPSFIPKTDQERIQNLPHYFSLHQSTQYEETLKLDGSSCTMYKALIVTDWQLFLNKWSFGLYKLPTHFGVCSRNIELKRPTSTDKQSNFWLVADKYSIEADLPIGYAIQGEVVAPNIQSNYEKVAEPMYYIFSVYSITNRTYLTPNESQAWVELYLPSALYVPVVEDSVTIFTHSPDFEQLQSRVTGPSINSSVKSEGRVYKALDGSHSFKCISDAYLLQKDK